jgi:hypothetical protein
MAEFVLLMWPVVMLWLFTKFDKQQALILSLLVGYLLLPQLITFQLPGIPGFDKHSIPAIVAAILLASKRHQITVAEPPRMDPIVKFLLAVFIFTPILTDLLNGDVLINGNTVRPGLTVISGIREVMGAYIDVLPLLLGYRYLHDYRGARMLCGYIVIAMLVYSIPMLIEVRFSPQINVWIYGYFQHDFLQTIRYGGYRPIVFLEHPLWVASITSFAFVFSVGLAKTDRSLRAKLTVAYLALVLLICKSAGALLLSMVFVPLIAFANPRRVLLISCMAVTLATLYPVLRSSSFMPLQGIVDLAMSISPERGRSLEFRLMNEEKLLERALEKPMLGWGGSGRSLNVSPYDGATVNVPDGLWVIFLGARGLVGYLSAFLLLASPVFLMYRAVARHRPPDNAEFALLGSMAVAVTMNVIDLIPNATLTPITWLIAGALLGNAARVLSGRPSPTSAPGGPQSKDPGLVTVI